MSQFGIRYGQGLKPLPILTVADVVATATATAYFDLDQLNWATVIVSFGAIASTDSTGEVVITVEASTAASSNATEGNVAFSYRLSAAVGTDSMGAITAATAAAGAAIPNTADNTVVLIDIDPAVVAASAADRRYVRLVITPTSEITSTIVGAILIAEPRYPGNAIPSST
jgi:hypothetical protein